MTWEPNPSQSSWQGPYYEFPPVGDPYTPVFTAASASASPPPGPLPLGMAIKQLPGQYKRILMQPGTASFSWEMGKAKWDIVLVQLIGLAVLSAALTSLIWLIFTAASDILFGSLLDQQPAVLPLLTLSSALLLAGALLVLVPASFFFSQGITYLLAKAFGGQGTFLAQVYTALLYQVPISIISLVLSLVPFVGSVASLASIYGYVLQAFSLMAVHRLSGGKATAVVLIPIAVGLVLGFAIALIVFASLIRALNSLPG